MKPVELPPDQAIVAKTHPPRYMMHKFWARKPHNVVAAYIDHFTKPGDIVLDPFVGSGVTICEALRSTRRAIGTDLSPIAVFVSRMTCLPLILSEFEDTTRFVDEELSKLTQDLYVTRCPKCGISREASHFVWISEATCSSCDRAWPTDESTRRGGYFYCPICNIPLPRGNPNQERLVKILVMCACEGSPRLKEKEPDEDDLRRATSASTGRLRTELSASLTVNARHDVFPGMTVGSLFTPRARLIVSTLRDLIDTSQCSDLTRQFVLFAFLASLPQSSRLHSIDFRPGRMFRSRGWTLPSYWIASGHFEQNARFSFLERCAKVRRGKIDSDKVIPQEMAKEARDIHALLRDEGKFLLMTTPASRLGDHIAVDSVDYVFTDPPYGDSITYLELSEIWNVWLGQPDQESYQAEIVISDADGRGKTLARYQEQLRAGFEAIHQVLRPGAWMSVTFHNRNIAVWNALLNAAVDAHFDFVNDTYQLPAMRSAKSGLQREGSMTGDVVLNFRKPIGVPSRLRARGIDVERLIVDEARQIMAERQGRASEDQLMRGVVHVLLKHGVVDRSPEDISKILLRYFERMDDGSWQFKKDSRASLLDFVPLGKRILWLVESALVPGPADLDDILERVFTNLKNGRTPESKEIWEVLERVAARMPDGRWRLRAPEDEAVQLKLGEASTRSQATEEREGADSLVTHDQLVQIVAEIALLRGHSVWIGNTEQRRNANLRNLSLPRLVIPGLTPDAIRDNRIDEIDVVWLRNGNLPLALFEIEHTTRAMTCIPRMGNLVRLVPHLALDVFVVAPDGLQKHVARQILSPSSRAILGDHPAKWHFLPYTAVLQLFEQSKEQRRRVDLEDLKQVGKPLPSVAAGNDTNRS